MHTNAVLAIVAGVLAVPTVWTLVNEGSEYTAVDEIPKLFEGFTPENVHFIRISKQKPKTETEGDGNAAPAAEELVIQRQDDGWALASGELAGAPIREYMVADELLANVKAMPASKDAVIVVDAKDEDLDKRGLTAETGLRITCLRNDGQTVLADLYLGNETNENEYGQDRVRGRYVRKVAADNDTGRKSILLFEKESMRVTTERGDYVDTKVLEIGDAAKIQKFAYKNATGTDVEFERSSETDPKWKMVKGPEKAGAVRQGEVDNLVNRFLFVNAQTYEGALDRIPPAERAAKYGIGGDASQFVVTATMQDGTTHRMTVGKKIDDKNEYWATFEACKFLCKVGDWVVSPFEKDGADLFDPPADAVQGDGDGSGNAPGDTDGAGNDEPKTDEPKTDEPKTDQSKKGADSDGAPKAGSGGD